MGTAATFFAAITTGFGVNSQVKLKPLTLLSGQTTTGAAPTDAVPPPSTWGNVGDGATIDTNGNWTPILGSIRVDGFRQIALSLEVFGSSGVVSATFRPYFWDGSRWCQCADTVVITNSQTSSTPSARQRHDIFIENDFGFVLVLEAISGTGATAAAYGILKDLVIGTR